MCAVAAELELCPCGLYENMCGKDAKAGGAEVGSGAFIAVCIMAIIFEVHP